MFIKIYIQINNKYLLIIMKYDYLIVGAGLFGSVFAYEMTKKGKKCLVIEKRNRIGGNVYTEEQGQDREYQRKADHGVHYSR